MEYGTSHFESKQAAVKYYAPYHHADAAKAVERKIAEGEIHIGPPTPKPGENVYLNRREGRYFIEDPGYVTMLKAEGWQVWMRNDPIAKHPGQYCFVTDGTHIAYAQWSDHRPGVSTVHLPNKTTGTGFQFAETITPDTVCKAMNCVAPAWASDKDRASVRKYTDWNEYLHANSFNEGLFQV